MTGTLQRADQRELDDALGLLWPPDPRWEPATDFYTMRDRRGEARGEVLRQWELVAEWEEDLEAYEV